jgi:hypothetical protein
MPLPGGLPPLAITGGNAGPSGADGNRNSAGGGNTWSFAPPRYQVQAQQAQAAGQNWQSVAFLAAAVGLAWLVLRK